MTVMHKRYRLETMLGSGGMGEVYRAVDRLTGRPVALKRLNITPDMLIFNSRGSMDADSSNYAAQLRLALTREFQVLASLRHPNIINVLDYGFDRATDSDSTTLMPYFTMTLLENAESFYDAMTNAPMQTKIDILIQVLRALSYLHRRGIVHRDLKPGNVMITRDQDGTPTARVLDFGLAVEGRNVGEVAGTPGYIAPEVLRGYGAGIAADLYAFGVMIYEAFAERQPFDSSSWAVMMQQILTEEPDLTPLPDALRIPIGILLAKDPDMRFPSADETIVALTTALNIPLPEDPPAVRESFLQAAQFVGRGWEFGMLLSGLDEAKRGKGSAWLIGGESGVGKSRLVDELRIHGLVEGASVMPGQAFAQGGLYFQTWREPLRRLALEFDLTDDEAGILKPIMPDIETLIGRPIPDAPSKGARADRERLINLIVDLFSRERDTHMLLILEDVHWTEESLIPLQRLSKIAHQRPLLIVATYRDDERADLPDQLGEMNRISLKRLTAEEIEQLSASMIGETASNPQLMSLLEQETEGNIFFLVETLRALAETAGRLSDIGRSSLPVRVMAGGVQAIIRRRLERAPDEARQWLKIAAVAGRQIDQRLMAHLGMTDIENWLTQCANVAILEYVDGVWRFSHDKLRETLLSDLTDAERPALHRAVAEGIETLYGKMQEYAPVLADHWRVAGDPIKEARYTDLAAHDWGMVGYYTQSIDRIEAVLTRLPESAIKERARLFAQLGRMYESLSDYERSAEYTLASLQLQESIGDRANMASGYNNLAIIYGQQGDLTKALKYFEMAMAIHRENNSLSGIATLANNLGIIYQWRGDFATARRYYDEALRAAEATDIKEEIINALNNRAFINAIDGDFWSASEDYQRGIALARQTGAIRSLSYLLMGMSDLLLYQGDLAGAREAATEAQTLCEQIGHKTGVVLCLIKFAIMAELTNDTDTALQFIGEAIQLAEETNYNSGLEDARLAEGFIRLARRETDAARVALRDGLKRAVEESSPYMILVGLVGFARLRLLEGDIVGAAARQRAIEAHPMGQCSNVQVRLLTLEAQLNGYQIDPSAIPTLDYNQAIQLALEKD